MKVHSEQGAALTIMQGEIQPDAERKQTKDSPAARRPHSSRGATKKPTWRKAVEADDNPDPHNEVSELSDSTTTDEDDTIYDDDDNHHHHNHTQTGQLRTDRSEDYENFEKTLRNKHSKACKAMSVRVDCCRGRIAFCR